MANSWGASGKQPALPPKSPGSTLPPSYVDYSSNLSLGTIGPSKSKQGFRHQRTSSESNLTLMEEQPSWLDDLLNEPDIPNRKGSHRRSSSDSFTRLGIPSLSSTLGNAAFHSFNNANIGSQATWKQEQPLCVDANSSKRPFGRKQETNMNTQNNSGSSNSLVKSKSVPQLSSISATKEAEASSSSAGHDQQESPQSAEDSHAKKTQSEMESKRVKQQHAQRSRVRKLQYIVELERTVQALQAERLEITGEIEFLSQQNLILSLENKALKQRFDNLSQEHLIKCFEHDMLEREMGRMQAFIHYQQLQQHQQQQQLQLQQQQQQLPRQHSQHQRPQQQNLNSSHSRSNSRDLDQQFSNLNSSHSRSNSRDLDQQFSNLSLKQKDGVHEDGQLHI